MKRRAVILGYGYMGTIRRAVLDQRTDCEVVRVVDGEGADWRAAAADPAVDCVFVCLPNHLTCEAVCRALGAGKDVFAEKPPGISVAEVRRMMEAEAASGKALKFGFNHRYHPAVIAAERRVATGELGAILWLRGRYGKPMAPDFGKGWRADRSRAGAGILLDQGIHMLDLMRAFCGGFDEAHAFASASSSSGVEDDLIAILRNARGQLASLHSSHTEWQPLFSLEVGLSEGAVALRGLLSRTGRYGPERLIWRARTESAEHVETFTQDDSWRLELDEFFLAAQGAAPVRVGSTVEALELMLLVEAIYASAGVPGWSSSSSS